MVDPRRNLNIYQKFTYGVVTTTESFFFNLGFAVGSKPILTIVLCWLIVFLSAFGALRFHQEKNPIKLWVPPESQFAKDTDWLMKTLEIGFRQETVIFTAPNILKPEVILQLLDIHEAVQYARSPKNVTWNDVCFKLPKIEKGLAKMISSETDNGKNDITTTMNVALFCSFLESIPLACFHQSILELWNYNRKEIESLTTEKIIERINNHQEMLFLGNLKNYTKLLSGIERDNDGHIISANAVQNIWMTKLNFSDVDMDKVGNIAGTADWASEGALDWELEFEATIEKIRDSLPSTMNLYFMSGRTYGDVTSATMFQDLDKLLIGGFIMAIYVQFVISKCNLLHIRVLLGGAGLLSVGMSYVVGIGLCSLIGIPYGPIHTSLPFLIMGLGVDDMFVIMACYDDLNKEQKKLPIPDYLGLILKHAGVSITITSVTDILAFLIGSSTIVPSLQSYCFYAAISVLMTFIFAVTFFCACLALDQQRIQNRKNGLIPCMKLKNYEMNSCSQKQISNRTFHFIFDKIILRPPIMVLIILTTIALAAYNITNCLKLEQKFDPHWFVPDTDQLSLFFRKRTELYPNSGFEGGIYMGLLNYTQEIPIIKKLIDDLSSNDKIINSVTDWLNPFRQYVLKTFSTDIYNETLSEAHFNIFLSRFLVNPQYAKYQSNFQFVRPMECGIPAPKIKMAVIPFSFPIFDGPSEYLPAMNKVRKIAHDANFTTGDAFCTAWSRTFATWVTDEVIDIEVLRNLELALLSVMVCTLLLVADLRTCFWIFICVLLSMVNVCGFMQVWGLTIDLVSCIGLELAIGLCVDYATHVGHTFLTVEGTKRERALKTVSTIGSAVLYGGLSTLIGVLMLWFSKAYTFQAFFKIFFLVIVFGLYHGVVVMPVILCVIGPDPYLTLHRIRVRATELQEMNCSKTKVQDVIDS